MNVKLIRQLIESYENWLYNQFDEVTPFGAVELSRCAVEYAQEDIERYECGELSIEKVEKIIQDNNAAWRGLKW